MAQTLAQKFTKACERLFAWRPTVTVEVTDQEATLYAINPQTGTSFRLKRRGLMPYVCYDGDCLNNSEIQARTSNIITSSQILSELAGALPVPYPQWAWGVVEANQVVELMAFRYGDRVGLPLFVTEARQLSYTCRTRLPNRWHDIEQFWQLVDTGDIINLANYLRRAQTLQWGASDNGKRDCLVIDGVLLLPPDVWQKPASSHQPSNLHDIRGRVE